MSMNINPEPIYAGCLRLVQTRNAPDNLGFSIELGQWQYNVGFMTVGATMIGTEAYRFKIRLDDGRIFEVFKDANGFIRWEFEEETEEYSAIVFDRPMVRVRKFTGLPDAHAYAEMRLAL